MSTSEVSQESVSWNLRDRPTYPYGDHVHEMDHGRTWVVVLAVIGVVFGGIHLTSLTDPGGGNIDYPTGKEAVSPGVLP
jgi:hypothetical protein